MASAPIEEAMLKKTPFQRKKWGVALCIVVIAMIVGYVIPKYSIGNGIKQVAHTQQEEYYAKKVIEYRKKYLKEHRFAQPLQLKVVDRKVDSSSKTTLRHSYHCRDVSDEHFDELYDELYKYIYTVRGYSWFGVEDQNAGDIVMGCALYEVGV